MIEYVDDDLEHDFRSHRLWCRKKKDSEVFISPKRASVWLQIHFTSILRMKSSRLAACWLVMKQNLADSGIMLLVRERYGRPLSNVKRSFGATALFSIRSVGRPIKTRGVSSTYHAWSPNVFFRIYLKLSTHVQGVDREPWRLWNLQVPVRVLFFAVNLLFQKLFLPRVLVLIG